MIDKSKRLDYPDQGRQRINAIQSRPLPGIGDVVNDGEWPILRTPRWKRGLDIAIILTILPAILPLIILTAIWIRVASFGPVIFRQSRIGRGGETFVLYKYRTMRMCTDASRHEKHMRKMIEENRPLLKLDCLGDPELIAGGLLLRASGLDELPQLLNVLRGEMSLVGPRPCLPYEYACYSPSQKERFRVVPGLTGSWQVCCKNPSTFAEMNSIDVDYVRSSSFAIDVRIIVQTPRVLLSQLCRAIHGTNHSKNVADSGLEFEKLSRSAR